MPIVQEMELRSRLLGTVCALFAGILVAFLGVSQAPAHDDDPVVAPLSISAAPATYALRADDAVASLLRTYYVTGGLWRDCAGSKCWVHNSDWGSDALTNTLYLRWLTSGDQSVLPMLAALSQTARTYPAPCRSGRCLLWSDVPNWDAVAMMRERAAAGGDPRILRKALRAFWAVEGSNQYARGACPAIRYQRPLGRGDHLKTLESDSNAIKAALLFYDATRDMRYLRIARTRYAAARRYFLDSRMSLYSVYVFDDGKHCMQVPHRFFASVNGNMIWNGLQLAADTGDPHYRTQAVSTALAVARDLSDANGIFSDLQAENDLEEPLVEGMLAVASREKRPFARRWLLENAAAAESDRRSDGTFGRFFDGPPPESIVTAFASNGGYAMQIAASALASGVAAPTASWDDAQFVSRDITQMPTTIKFHGSGIALIGTIGEVCCQAGHARVLIDGTETVSRVGMWQNKSSSGQSLPNSVLFAWCWPSAGDHQVTLEPADYDAKEGGAFVHTRGYMVRN